MNMQLSIGRLIPSPIKSMFSSKSKKKVPKKNEGAALFRQLGVSEDATFEEIQEATLRLRMKFKGDRKMQIRVDKLKDDIMEFKLKERMENISQGGSREASAAAEAERKLLSKKKEFKMPKWSNGLIVFPDRDWASSAVYPFLIFGGFGVVFPSSSKLLILVSAITAISKMSTREAPPIMKDELGQMGPMPMPSRTTVILTLFCALSAGLIGAQMGKIMGSYFGYTILIPESWTVFGIELMFALSSVFLSTYRK